MQYFYRKLSLFLILFSFSFSSFAYYDNADDNEMQYIPQILIVADDNEAADLESQGVIIWHRREDMALALVPRGVYNSRTNIRQRKDKKIIRSHRMRPVMDIAKTFYDADKIQKGIGLPQPYTGKGVVVGFCDVGFDPHHVNFLDKDGNTRVKRLVYYDEPHAVRKVMDSPQEIKNWSTDDVNNSHATHVAGIMTGSYNENGYSGMAPDAEIVGVTSKLYDVGILSACEDIIEYANSVGKPAVINLSLGSYNGPHDGSSLFNRYMSLLGEEAIICMAAGNEGGNDNSYRITFGSDQPNWRVRVHSYDWVQFDMYGMTDIWSYDERPVNVKFHIYDEVTNASVFEAELCTGQTDYPYIIDSENDPLFASFMTGTIYIDGRVNETNGRWVTEIEYDTHTEFGNPVADNRWARYNIALEFSGESGVSADITNDCQYSKLVTWPGYPSPTSDLSVSDIATGNNVICVGMYNTRDEYPLLDGSFKKTPWEPMIVNYGSGYGTLVNSRVLPHSVAPGCVIISSASSPFLEENPEALSSASAVAVYNGKKYYWNQNSGTSMSTPYLAGVVATCLEANPGLTVNDVKKILAETNSTDVCDMSDPRNGRGWFQPYDAIKSVIKSTGSDNIGIDSSDIKIVLNGNYADIFNPSGIPMSISLLSVSGISIMPVFDTDKRLHTIDLSSLPKGIYLLSVSSPSQKPLVVKFIR